MTSITVTLRNVTPYYDYLKIFTPPFDTKFLTTYERAIFKKCE